MTRRPARTAPAVAAALVAALLLAGPGPLRAEELETPASALRPPAEAFEPPSPAVPLRIVASPRPERTARGSTWTLRIDGALAEGFYVYGAFGAIPDGPGPTRIALTDTPLPLHGALRESPPARLWDAVFKTELQVHRGAFWLEQDFDVPPALPPGDYIVAGAVAYQVCDGRVCSVVRRGPFAVRVSVY